MSKKHILKVMSISLITSSIFLFSTHSAFANISDLVAPDPEQQNQLYANVFLRQISNIIGASNVLHDTGNKSFVGVLDMETLRALLPPDNLKTAWGADITVSNITDNSFTIATQPFPEQVCNILLKDVTNKSIQIGDGCKNIVYTIPQ